VTGKRRRREPTNDERVAELNAADVEVKAFAKRVQEAGGVKAWRHRHNEGGKAKPERGE
jgi:hypothetical protein